MSLAKRCDRCGCLYSKNTIEDQKFSLKAKTPIIGGVMKVDHKGNFYDTPIDFCDGCVFDFINFMSGFPIGSLRKEKIHEMTLEEIEKKLGYSVKIVTKENKND